MREGAGGPADSGAEGDAPDVAPGADTDADELAAAAAVGELGPEPPPSDSPTAGANAWRPRGWQPGIALPAAVGIAGGILLAQATTAVYQQLRGLLAIAVVSLFLSFALEPAVQWQARRGIRRGIGTGLVFLVSLLLVIGFTAAMAGLVVDQVRTLVNTTPTLIDGLAAQAERVPGELGESLVGWLEEQRQLLPNRVAGVAGIVGRGAIGLGQTVIGMVFQFATIALVTFYLVADGPKLRRKLASRLPVLQQVRVLGLWELAIAKTGGYVYSRVLTAIVSAAFHITVFSLLGVQYAVALGVWVGLISSIIPAVGTYIAGALPIIVALATSPTQALWVLVAITTYQQVENYVVVPRITASTLELHPAIAFLAVVAGAALAGVPGALLAIPATAIVTSLLAAATEEYDVLKHELVQTSGPDVVDAIVDARHRSSGDTAGSAGRDAATLAEGAQPVRRAADEQGA